MPGDYLVKPIVCEVIIRVRMSLKYETLFFLQLNIIYVSYMKHKLENDQNLKILSGSKFKHLTGTACCYSN